VVDNNSQDGSRTFLKDVYKTVTVVNSQENLGFAGGNMLGIQHAKGDYLLLLNNDTRVEKDFIENFIEVFAVFPSVAIAQSKIVMMSNPQIIDSCGSYWTDSAFLYHIGNDKSASLSRYNKPFRVFSVKGAAMLVKKDVFEALGGFDNDFWCYYEETDLCHRAWIAGYECLYWPKAVVSHAIGGTSLSFVSETIQFHSFKNRLLSFLKNFEVSHLLSIVPVYLLSSILISVLWIFQGKFSSAFAIYKAIFWNLTHIKKTLTKRSDVQSKRKKTDKDYFTFGKKNPRFQYYFSLFSRKFDAYED
jgi:GT2 family glycosyltransferase